MGAATKLLLGLFLIGFGGFLLRTWQNDFLIMLRGVVPALLIVLGVLVVWIEREEMRAGPEPKPEEFIGKSKRSKS
ncbi:MAG: hypothetical protein HY366_03355 [Candidatus Aenigmarchaeota archaeon]|nr:hypothetical protein [Candidatus Aenigmarchaeota archaeon]